MNAIIVHSIDATKGDIDARIKDFQKFLNLRESEMSVLPGEKFTLTPGGSLSPFVYDRCTKKTKLVIALWMPKAFPYELLFNHISEGITVEKKQRAPFEIAPFFLFMTADTPYQIGEGYASFKARFMCFDARENHLTPPSQ